MTMKWDICILVDRTKDASTKSDGKVLAALYQPGKIDGVSGGITNIYYQTEILVFTNSGLDGYKTDTKRLRKIRVGDTLIDNRQYSSAEEKNVLNARNAFGTHPSFTHHSRLLVDNHEALFRTKNNYRIPEQYAILMQNTVARMQPTTKELTQLFNDPVILKFLEQQHFAQSVSRAPTVNTSLDAVTRLQQILDCTNMGPIGIFGGIKLYENIESPTDLGEFIANDDTHTQRLADLVSGYGGFYILSKNAYDYRPKGKEGPSTTVNNTKHYYKTFKYGIFGENGTSENKMKSRFNAYLRDVGHTSADNPCGGVNLHYLELFQFKSASKGTPDTQMGAYVKECEDLMKYLLHKRYESERFRTTGNTMIKKGEHVILTPNELQFFLDFIKNHLSRNTSPSMAILKRDHTNLEKHSETDAQLILDTLETVKKTYKTMVGRSNDALGTAFSTKQQNPFPEPQNKNKKRKISNP